MVVCGISAPLSHELTPRLPPQYSVALRFLDADGFSLQLATYTSASSLEGIPLNSSKTFDGTISMRPARALAVASIRL